MKEINRYRLALIQYQLSHFFNMEWLNYILKTESGFCHHFGEYPWSGNFSGNLPKLYSLRNIFIHHHEFWLPSGELKPRIELLKKAIKLCKNK